MSVLVTEAAARQILKTIARRGRGIGLRLAVKAAGCSGLSYVMEVADEVADGETEFESQGVRVMVPAKSLGYIDGVEVDFVRQGLSEGFKFRNPNAKGTCGCGESFAA